MTLAQELAAAVVQRVTGNGPLPPSSNPTAANVRKRLLALNDADLVAALMDEAVLLFRRELEISVIDVREGTTSAAERRKSEHTVKEVAAMLRDVVRNAPDAAVLAMKQG